MTICVVVVFALVAAYALVVSRDAYWVPGRARSTSSSPARPRPQVGLLLVHPATGGPVGVLVDAGDDSRGGRGRRESRLRSRGAGRVVRRPLLAPVPRSLPPAGRDLAMVLLLSSMVRPRPGAGRGGR